MKMYFVAVVIFAVVTILPGDCGNVIIRGDIDYCVNKLCTLSQPTCATKFQLGLPSFPQGNCFGNSCYGKECLHIELAYSFAHQIYKLRV